MPRKLTEEQLDSWNRDGYLVLKNALTRKDVSELRSDVDRLYRKVSRKKGKSHRRDSTKETYWPIAVGSFASSTTAPRSALFDS